MHPRLFAACIAICCAVTTSPQALPELRISPPIDSVLVGDTAMVHVTISSVNDLYGAGFDLAFDPDRLHYLGATEGSFLDAGGSVPTIFVVTWDTAAGTLLAGLTRSSYQVGGASTEVPAVLMSLRFEVLAEGSSLLDITRSSLTAPDGVTKYPHDVVDGWVFATIPTAVSDEGSRADLPTGFILSPPYPNPFNGSTRLSLAVERRQAVRVGVIDVLGRTVAQIFEGELPVGRSMFVWDGRSRDGIYAGTGVYFFFVQGHVHSEVRKVVLVK